MTNHYQAVQWNAHKRTYDLAIAAFIGLFLLSFVVLGRLMFPAPEDISLAVLLIRGLGVCAVVLLHLILLIGPLSRLSTRFSPVLYNRRHLGVSFFVVAFLHASIVIGYYGGFGVRNPLIVVLEGSGPGSGPPFEFYGFLALLIFALMAATSHDFWLKNLGPAFWKSMHMGVYVAYALVVAHIVFGAMRSESNIIPIVLLSFGVLTLIALHLVVGLREVQRDYRSLAIVIEESGRDQWVDVCSVDDIAPDRAKVVQINTHERIAVFRHQNTISAITNVCAHQGGPLGEGKIIDGCVTCPWHGYQYKPECGQSPPPYTEKIATYEVRIEGRRVLIDPNPNPPGTHVDPAGFAPWDNALDAEHHG